MVSNISQNLNNNIYLTLLQNDKVENFDFQNLLENNEDENKSNKIDDETKNRVNKLLDVLNTEFNDAVSRLDSYNNTQEENKYKDRFQNIIDGIMLKLSQKIKENNAYEKPQELPIQDTDEINTENTINTENLNNGLNLSEIKSIVETSLSISSYGKIDNSAIQTVQDTINQISEALTKNDTKAINSILENSNDIIEETKTLLKSENLFNSSKSSNISFSKKLKDIFDIELQNKIFSDKNNFSSFENNINNSSKYRQNLIMQNYGSCFYL